MRSLAIFVGVVMILSLIDNHSSAFLKKPEKCKENAIGLEALNSNPQVDTLTSIISAKYQSFGEKKKPKTIKVIENTNIPQQPQPQAQPQTQSVVKSINVNPNLYPNTGIFNNFERTEYFSCHPGGVFYIDKTWYRGWEFFKIIEIDKDNKKQYLIFSDAFKKYLRIQGDLVKCDAQTPNDATPFEFINHGAAFKISGAGKFIYKGPKIGNNQQTAAGFDVGRGTFYFNNAYYNKFRKN